LVRDSLHNIDAVMIPVGAGQMAIDFGRRVFVTLLGGAALAARRLPFSDWASCAEAQENAASAVWRYGMSLFGDLKYPSGFKQFDYVNTNAPKGGTVRQIALGTYDNFNIVVAGVKGSLAAGIDLIYDTLSVASLDEVSSEYGLIAEAMSYPDDFSSASYQLRAEAKWHDGMPVTPDDVIFSFNAFKKLSPQFSAYYRHVVGVEKTGDREVTFNFDGPGNRELPQIVGQLTILSKEWWEGTNADGKNAISARPRSRRRLAAASTASSSFRRGATLCMSA